MKLLKSSIYLILPTALGPMVYSAVNRNEYQKQVKKNVSGGIALLAHKADNLNTICELIVYTVWDPQHLITL
jgi:hypothetical protein